MAKLCQCFGAAGDLLPAGQVAGDCHARARWAYKKMIGTKSSFDYRAIFALLGVNKAGLYINSPAAKSGRGRAQLASPSSCRSSCPSAQWD